MKKKKSKKEKIIKEKIVGLGSIFFIIRAIISSILRLADRTIRAGKESAEEKGIIKGEIMGIPMRVFYNYKIKIGLKKQK